jgi:hypothetical protein
MFRSNSSKIMKRETISIFLQFFELLTAVFKTCRSHLKNSTSIKCKNHEKIHDQFMLTIHLWNLAVKKLPLLHIDKM